MATPAIIGAVLDDKVLVKEFVEGERLSDIVQAILTGRSSGDRTVERFGEAMGAIHKAGFALGDSKATNVIVKGDGACTSPTWSRQSRVATRRGTSRPSSTTRQSSRSRRRG